MRAGSSSPIWTADRLAARWRRQRSGSRARARAPSRPRSPLWLREPAWPSLPSPSSGGRRCSPSSSRSPSRSASTTPTTTPTACAAPTPSGSDRSGSSAPASPPLAGSSRPRIASFAVAGVVGLVLAATTSWWLIAVGAVCIVAAWFYTGGSRPYGYRALGEVSVFVFFGLVAVLGTVYVQTEHIATSDVWAACGIGSLACAILVANNLRDIPTDRETGKRTLAVVMGDQRLTRPLHVAARRRVRVPGADREGPDAVGARRPRSQHRSRSARWLSYAAARSGLPSSQRCATPASPSCCTPSACSPGSSSTASRDSSGTSAARATAPSPHAPAHRAHILMSAPNVDAAVPLTDTLAFGATPFSGDPRSGLQLVGSSRSLIVLVLVVFGRLPRCRTPP